VAIRAQPATAWRPEDEDAHAVRPWAEVPYVPSDGVATKHRPEPPRYLTVRITRRRGELFADGSGRDLICWQRAKAGRVEHSHPVLTNELAAEALPSQRFGANAAWFRLKVLL
jgi:hypothetical protein